MYLAILPSYSGFLLANSEFKENRSVVNAGQSGPESYSAWDASYGARELVMEREREGFGDPERIGRDNVMGSLHGERTAVMLISWEALGGDPGPVCGAGKGVMAAAGIGRACPSLDVRPQAPKETGCLVSRFPVPISEFSHLPQVLI